jgi:hypothetical protein
LDLFLKDGDDFICHVKVNGKICAERVPSKQSNTTNIKNHLKRKHNISDNGVKRKLNDHFKPKAPEKKHEFKSFRDAYIYMVVKQYLPFSMIEEQAVQDCFIAFAKEHGVVLDSRPKFARLIVDSSKTRYIEKSTILGGIVG